MTVLGTLFEEVNAKQASYLIRVGGLNYVCENFAYNFAMGEVPSATFEIRNPLPSAIVYSAPVEIYAGYNGILQLVFTGQVETPTPGPVTTSVECSGISRKLRVPYKRLVIVLNGQDANDAVSDMLDDAGVTNYVVNLEAWAVGAIVAATLEFQTYDDAINKVATVDGSPWYELPTGQIRVELRDPWPAPTYFRQYYSGDLRNLTDIQRAQWLAGTLPLADIQPSGIINPNAQPRVRDGVRLTTLLSNVRNQIYVEGAVLDVTGPDGEATSARIEAVAQNTVPWIPDGRFQDWTFDNELIDTQAKADTVAARKFAQLSRLDQRVALSIDGDPELSLGMTVNVEDPAFTGITGNWFVYGYRGRMDSSGYVVDLDLRGGVNAGITPLIAPVADFIFANEYIPFAKIHQVTPATNGAILINFDGRSSFDPDGQIVSWAWSDDQGNTGSGSVIQFAYDAALSTIVMTLTVTDNDGLTDSISKTVHINGTNGSCGDAGSSQIFAAIKTHMSASLDGGTTWTDVSKAAAAATGDFCAVGHSGRSPYVTVYSALNDADPVAMYGTTAGEIYRTADGLQTYTKWTIPSGRKIVGIFALDPGSSLFEYWWVCDDIGNVYVFVYRRENGDYAGPTLYYSDGLATVSATVFVQGGTYPVEGQVWAPRADVYLVGGDSANPDTMIRHATGQLDNQDSNGGTFGWAIGGSLVNFVPPFSQAMRDAIVAAGSGHTAQSLDGLLRFLPPDFANITAERRFGLIFTDGVDPRAWFYDGTAWQAAVGLTGGLNGKFITLGFDQDFQLAVLAQLKTFSAPDGINYVEAGNDAPSQINYLTWELGLKDVYLGAAAGGLVKSLDAGDSWGYIRPHAGVGTTWPVGAEGLQVGIAFTLPPPCPNVYTLSRDSGGVDDVLNLSGSVWQRVENTRSQNSFGLQYLGGSGRMIHLQDNTVPQVSSDYGVMWGAATGPGGGYTICSAVAMDAAQERLWGLWRNGNTITGDSTAICYSTDWGATWTVAATDTTVLHYYLDIACHPTDKSRIVVSGAHTFTGVTWSTTDRGATWAQHNGPALANGLVYRNHNSPSAGFKSQCITFSPYGRLIWSTGGRAADGDVYYSDDYGVNWTKSDYDFTPPLGEGMVQLLRCGPFGPYYSVHFARNGATSNIFRSDDHGAHWIAVGPPDNDDDNYNGVGYDPLKNVVLFHRDDTSEVWGLDPVTNTWSDLTSNYNSFGAPGPVMQPLTFVGDPASAGP